MQTIWLIVRAKLIVSTHTKKENQTDNLLTSISSCFSRNFSRCTYHIVCILLVCYVWCVLLLYLFYSFSCSCYCSMQTYCFICPLKLLTNKATESVFIVHTHRHLDLTQLMYAKWAINYNCSFHWSISQECKLHASVQWTHSHTSIRLWTVI